MFTALLLTIACSSPPASEACGACDACVQVEWSPSPPFGIDADTDTDGDGYGVNDCDDGDAEIHPGADEVCDGADNDCDGEADEDAVDEEVWYLDADGDGYGGVERTWACEQPEGYVADATDCDDDDDTRHPDAGEVYGDGIDNDCDGEVDGECEEAAADLTLTLLVEDMVILDELGETVAAWEVVGTGPVCEWTCHGHDDEGYTATFLSSRADCGDAYLPPFDVAGAPVYACVQYTGRSGGSGGLCTLYAGGESYVTLAVIH